MTLKSEVPVLHWYNGELLTMAENLGRRLLPSFNTSTGIPHGKVSSALNFPSKNKQKTYDEYISIIFLQSKIFLDFVQNPFRTRDLKWFDLQFRSFQRIIINHKNCFHKLYLLVFWNFIFYNFSIRSISDTAYAVYPSLGKHALLVQAQWFWSLLPFPASLAILSMNKRHTKLWTGSGRSDIGKIYNYFAYGDRSSWHFALASLAHVLKYN